MCTVVHEGSSGTVHSAEVAPPQDGGQGMLLLPLDHRLWRSEDYSFEHPEHGHCLLLMWLQ